MSETTAPQPVAQEPTKIPAPTQAGPQGAAALAESEPKADNPFEFELDVQGQKQKLAFKDKDQLKAVLQKALYADQVIKDATQAKKGAAELMNKLKTPQGLREILSDPAIGMDYKKFALDAVREMMEDEKLTDEQRELRKYRTEAEQLKAEKEERIRAEQTAKEQERSKQQAAEIRGQIIDAMKKYPDIPQTQATMDAVIQNMRAAFRRFGKHITAEQAMTVYSGQYWKSLSGILEKMEPENILERFGQKTLDKIQQFKYNQLKAKTDPSKKTVNTDTEVKKKKHLTEKEFEKHFSQTMGLAGL